MAGDSGYPVEGKPKSALLPLDTMVAFGRPKGYRGSYSSGKKRAFAPQVVFEVPSPGNRLVEHDPQVSILRAVRYDDSILYDPESGALQGWLRGVSGLEEIAEMSGFTSPRLGIRFEPGEGPDNLKIIGPDGRPFLTYVELFEDREAQLRIAHAERAACRSRAKRAKLSE